MAITVRGAAGGNTGTGGTSLVLPFPSNIVAGDTIIATITFAGQVNVTAKGGWTAIDARLSYYGATPDWVGQNTYWHVVTSTDVLAQNTTFTLSGSVKASAVCVALAGVVTATTPVKNTHYYLTSQGVLNTASVTFPSLGQTVSNGILLALAGAAYGTTFTAPTGFGVPLNGLNSSTGAPNSSRTTTVASYQILTGAATGGGALTGTFGNTSGLNWGVQMYVAAATTNTTASAGVAQSTGSTQAPATSAAPSSATATGIASALNAIVSSATTASAGSAVGTAIARQPTTSTTASTTASAGAASGTSAAQPATPTAPAQPTTAIGSAIGRSPTTSTSSATTVQAGSGAASVTVPSAIPSAPARPGTASATAAANNISLSTTASTSAQPGAASASATARTGSGAPKPTPAPATASAAGFAAVVPESATSPGEWLPITVVVTGAGAYTTPPGPPKAGQPFSPQPSPTYIAKILYDDIDITQLVVFADAEFTTRVNGQPGECRFRVKDVDHSFTFRVGRPISLSINGLAEWTGYVSRISRETAFPYGPSTQTRFWAIEGVDVNILFRRRVTFKKSDPKDVHGTTWKYNGTPVKDTAAISDLVTNYLDLTKDGIDTSSRVSNVANINVDQDANPFSPGWTWEQAMNEINRLPVAVYYIDPQKRLVWEDVDTVTAPFGLSDTPNGSTTYGYREADISYDATNLTNDFYAWGAGAGSPNMVFARSYDAASVTAHGLWQDSTLVTDVYKQNTINRISSSYVYGSPSSKRGHKDDRVSVVCTTFRQGLQAGMGVSFTCTAHDYSDVIPIRQSTITFPTPTNPRYKLTLSHELDAIWTFTDVYHPKWRAPRGGLTEKQYVAAGDSCIVDRFDRATGSQTVDATTTAWGQMTSGYGTANHYWYSSSPTGARQWVDSEGGHLLIPSQTRSNGSRYYTFVSYIGSSSTLYPTTPITDPPVDIYFTVDWRNVPGDRPTQQGGAVGTAYLITDVGGYNDLWPYTFEGGTMTIVPSQTVANSYFDFWSPHFFDYRWAGNLQTSPGGDPDYLGLAPDISHKFNAHWHVETNSISVTLWPYGTAEPSNPTVYLPTILYPVNHVGLSFTVQAYSGSYPVNNFQAIISDIRVCPNSATSITTSDEFTRSVSGNLGTGSLGAWQQTTYGGSSASVDGSTAVFSVTPYNAVDETISGPGPWSSDFDMIARIYLEMSSTSGTSFSFGGNTSDGGSIGFDAPLCTWDGSTLGPRITVLKLVNSVVSGGVSTEATQLLSFNSRGWYLVRWKKVGAQMWASIWAEGTAEPAWMATLPCQMGGMTQFAMSVGDSYGYQNPANIDYIRFTTIAGSGPSGSGLSGTSLDFGSPYFKGTTKVWKNGKILRLGVDYTENPSSGTVTLTTALTVSDTVTATFVASTGANGGVTRRVL